MKLTWKARNPVEICPERKTIGVPKEQDASDQLWSNRPWGTGEISRIKPTQGA